MVLTFKPVMMCYTKYITVVDFCTLAFQLLQLSELALATSNHRKDETEAKESRKNNTKKSESQYFQVGHPKHKTHTDINVAIKILLLIMILYISKCSLCSYPVIQR